MPIFFGRALISSTVIHSVLISLIIIFTSKTIQSKHSEPIQFTIVHTDKILPVTIISTNKKDTTNTKPNPNKYSSKNTALQNNNFQNKVNENKLQNQLTKSKVKTDNNTNTKNIKNVTPNNSHKKTILKSKIIKKAKPATKNIIKKPAKFKSDTKKQTPQKKVEKSNRNTKENDVITSILKSLENDISLTETNDKKDNSNELPLKEQVLALNEQSYIKQKIEQNWENPMAIKHLNNITVLLNIKIGKNKVVNHVEIKEILCDHSKELCKIFADSAIKAVMQSSPLENLTEDRHDVWKELNLLFNPENILK
ncbi:hypothetical protein [Rickettsia endosymbiont of Cardiosporidium cionae]|uniref:hypothetical protein n=1 Tax=Rickettsia endosymbiont of Cardiosporidium cionae TaxID=2777155 RepID=UPI0018941F3E|nr:hypothetical protein [Rickettsia endosymbiont of Cardiosporidium cionae]KAF8818412.1 hypothetical protein IHI24_000502 [Rickettsia endosymbiont of Cardiosporidium cionae]